MESKSLLLDLCCMETTLPLVLFSYLLNRTHKPTIIMQLLTKSQLIHAIIKLLFIQNEYTIFLQLPLSLRLAVKSDNSSPVILSVTWKKHDATIKLSLTHPTHSCHCPHGQMKSCVTHNGFYEISQILIPVGDWS